MGMTWSRILDASENQFKVCGILSFTSPLLNHLFLLRLERPVENGSLFSLSISFSEKQERMNEFQEKHEKAQIAIETLSKRSPTPEVANDLSLSI